jgi:asparagine synthase (glutamine-hydrolysing)
MAAVCEKSGGSSDAALKLGAILRTSGGLAEVLPIMRQLFPESQRKEVISDHLRPLIRDWSDPCSEVVREAQERTPSVPPLAITSFAETRTYMHDLLLRDTDQMTMAHGLEARVPLLDHLLAEHIFGLPDEYRTPGKVPKALLVESGGAELPGEVVFRPKQGFTLPLSSWMRRELMQFCEERLAFDRVHQRGLLNPFRVQKLWTAFKGGDKRVSWTRIWACVVLEDWLDRNQLDY